MNFSTTVMDTSDRIVDGLLCKSGKVRASTLKVMMHSYPPDYKLNKICALDTVIWYSEDGDGRVRYAAILCVKNWLSKFINSSAWNTSRINSTYKAACESLLDLNIPTRCIGLESVANILSKWPENTLPCSNKRTIEHAFSKICGMVQDPEKLVRCLAVKLIGDVCHLVSEDQLLLLIQKTLLKERHVKKGAYVKKDEVSVKATGCTGALIAGLEDDFHEVRNEALLTISKICSVSQKFALVCQEIVVEMLADDIPHVRMGAVKALATIGKQVPLRPEQMSIITAAMCEGSPHMRKCLLVLLSKSILASSPCILNIIDALLKNLKRYPEDKMYIWSCAASIGQNNANFVGLCLLSLLRLHPYLSNGEDITAKEDPSYLTVSIMVLNAARLVKGMPSNLPPSFSLTELYLQELVPSLLITKNCDPDYTLHISNLANCLMHNCDILSSVMKMVKKSIVNSSDPLSNFKKRDLNLVHQCVCYELKPLVNKSSVKGKAYMDWTLRLCQMVYLIICAIHNDFEMMRCDKKQLKSGEKLLRKVVDLGRRNEFLIVGKDSEDQSYIQRLNVLLKKLFFTRIEPEQKRSMLKESLDVMLSLLPPSEDSIYRKQHKFKEIQMHFIQPRTSYNGIKVTPTIASVGVKVRAQIFNVSVEEAREKICVVCKRTELDAHEKHLIFHPPKQHFYSSDFLLDEATTFNSAADGFDSVELNTVLEFSVSCASDLFSVEIILGYRCGPAMHDVIFIGEQNCELVQQSWRLVKIESKNSFNK